jgi:hypothetical protein
MPLLAMKVSMAELKRIGMWIMEARRKPVL